MREATMTRVRHNIWNLGTPQDPWHPITLGYALGVRAMQALPVTDPRSWTYQAAIHGNLPDEQTQRCPVEPVPARHLVLRALAPDVPVPVREHPPVAAARGRSGFLGAV